jgi:hypothetical protein
MRLYCATFVYPAQQLNLELARSPVFDKFEFANVTIQLQNSQNTSKQFARRTDDAGRFVSKFVVHQCGQAVRQRVKCWHLFSLLLTDIS